jgi:drug/metabolite transporter (DMT)-like permease
MLGEPIGSSILAYIFLDEKPPVVKIIGAILILAGIGLASFQQISQPENQG